jgi:TonB family protein
MRFFCSLFLTASLLAQQSAPKEADLVTISTETAMQHLTNYAAPKYPSVAENSGIKGTVTMHVTISEAGAVKNIKIKSGHPFFINAAMEAVRKWQFTPFDKAVQTDLNVDFTPPMSKAELEKFDKFSTTYFRAYDAARAALIKRDYPEAEKQVAIALSSVEPVAEQRWLEFSSALFLNAEIRTYQKDWAGGEKLYRRALEVRLKHQKEDEAEVADVEAALGSNLFAQGRSAEAIENWTKAVTTYKALLPKSDPDTIPEAIASYKRQIATYSFFLATLARVNNRPEAMKANCTDALAYSAAVKEDSQRAIKQLCATTK